MSLLEPLSLTHGAIKWLKSHRPLSKISRTVSMTTQPNSSLMTFCRHGRNCIKLHCIFSLSGFMSHFPCGTNMIQRACCEVPRPNRLSQLVHTPTALSHSMERGVKHPHSGSSWTDGCTSHSNLFSRSLPQLRGRRIWILKGYCVSTVVHISLDCLHPFIFTHFSPLPTHVLSPAPLFPRPLCDHVAW